MDKLSDDLLLLAVSVSRVPDVRFGFWLEFGLAGAELVRLAAAGRVSIERGRITVRSTEPTGDALLDEALARTPRVRFREPAKNWIEYRPTGSLSGTSPGR